MLLSFSTAIFFFSFQLENVTIPGEVSLCPTQIYLWKFNEGSKNCTITWTCWTGVCSGYQIEMLARALNYMGQIKRCMQYSHRSRWMLVSVKTFWNFSYFRIVHVWKISSDSFGILSSIYFEVSIPLIPFICITKHQTFFIDGKGKIFLYVCRKNNKRK